MQFKKCKLVLAIWTNANGYFPLLKLLLLLQKHGKDKVQFYLDAVLITAV